MHLSDGFLDFPTALATSAAAAGAMGVSIWQLRRGSEEAPSAGRMAVVGAAVFAAQAINFPLADGISGHLLGGAAAAAVLGPWAGMLVVSAVLAVQCLLLGDGGLSALGANVLNMAVLGSLLGWPVWRLRAAGRGARGAGVGMRVSGAHGAKSSGSASDVALAVFGFARYRQAVVAAVAGAVAAAAALPLGALACAIEMHVSGRADFLATVGQMVPLHLVLGMAEGLFTAAAVLVAANPWPAYGGSHWLSQCHRRRAAVAVLAIVAVAAVLGPQSSPLPDTLENAVNRLGVAAAAPLVDAALSEDAFSAAGSWFASTLPIVLGTLLAAAAAVLVERSLRSAAARAANGRRDED